MRRAVYKREEQPQLGLGLVEAEGANAGVGDENDFYPTPAAAVLPILAHLPRGGTWVDPSAGTGALLDAAMKDGAASLVSGIEIDPTRARVCQEKGLDVELNDALVIPTWPCANVYIQNPSFNLAQEFVERALQEAARQGGKPTVATLLRLAFLEGQERAAFHRAFPADVYVLAARPQFIDPKAWRPCSKCLGARTITFGTSPPTKCPSCKGRGEIKGGTSGAAHAWFVHGPGRGGRWFILGGAS